MKSINKEKIPSQFSKLVSPIVNINASFINFSKQGCGRTENRTRNFWVTTNCFTTKLLAHNDKFDALSYLNFDFHYLKATK